MKAGEYSCLDLTGAYLNEIEKKNPKLNAYLEVFTESALKEAKIADKKFKEGTATLLTGIPIAVKDNILIKGKIASAGSKILENYKATYDATVVKKLKKEKAVFLGRTNLDEFAMGASTENSAFGVTKNPHDIERVSGGSSGGSAAAVAANLCLAALGSDTAGSIRQPSSFCGVVGLKPTYGAVSRYGLIALGSSLDCIGPIVKNVRDAEIIQEAIKGWDKSDSTSLREVKSQKLKIEKSKFTVGVPNIRLTDGQIKSETLKNLEEAIEKLKSLGYKVKSIELPNLRYAVPAYYIILPAEASANLARYDGVKYGLREKGENLMETYFKTRGRGFGPEVRRRIFIGTYVLSAGYLDAYYNKANAVRDLIKKDFEKAFEEVDLILTPTTAGPAFKIGEKSADPVQMYLEDIFTVPANHTGLPAISIPYGQAEEMPLGIQFIASHQNESLLFKVSKDFLGEKD